MVEYTMSLKEGTGGEKPEVHAWQSLPANFLRARESPWSILVVFSFKLVFLETRKGEGKEKVCYLKFASHTLINNGKIG